MPSTDYTTSQGTALAPDDDLFYEVVDEKIVELAPMGAYEIRLASVLQAHLEIFASQHQLGRAVQEMLFDLGPTVRRKRRPDVAFVSYERWPRQRRVPRAEAWDVVPNLAVEVVSRSDKGRRHCGQGRRILSRWCRKRLGRLSFPGTGLYLRVTQQCAYPHPRRCITW